MGSLCDIEKVTSVYNFPRWPPLRPPQPFNYLLKFSATGVNSTTCVHALKNIHKSLKACTHVAEKNMAKERQFGPRDRAVVWDTSASGFHQPAVLPWDFTPLGVTTL